MKKDVALSQAQITGLTVNTKKHANKRLVSKVDASVTLGRRDMVVLVSRLRESL